MEANLIKETLGRLRISQAMLARGIRVNPRSVHLWCIGDRYPSGNHASNMLAFLRRYDPELDLEDLIPSTIGEAE